MTATDELRRMLDERGVGCVTDDGEYVKRTTWHGVGDKRATFVEYVNGECRFSMDDYNFTPEQSIAATLGHSLNNPSISETLSERGTCRIERNERGCNFVYRLYTLSCGHTVWTMGDAPGYCVTCGRKVEG